MPLLGRERELASITDRLRRPDVRMITLTGAGGSGKTRLALEVAASDEVRSAFKTYFVDLTPLTDAVLVAPTIAAVLGVQEAPHELPLQAVQRALRADSTLLVLDNFEHVLSAAGIVSELLVACSRLKILATSREPLHLRWERDVPVGPLMLPDPRHPATLALVDQSPAVRLFVQRAQAARPAFALSEENANSIAALCAALDGLPLAIELAASWIRVLDPTDLMAHLQGRLGNLVARARDAPARHRTLWSAIGWSYDRLTPTEQAVCCRLAVFAGGCTLAAMEAVTRATDAFEILSSLVDKNLVVYVAQPDETPRYRMLETIRAFALEQLEERGELEATRACHADYFLAWAERMEADLFANRNLLRYVEFGREQDNLRAALRWYLEAGAAEFGLRLGAVVWLYWFGRSQFAEGRQWLEALLALSGARTPTHARARVLCGLAGLALRQVDVAAMQSAAEEALPLAEMFGDARLVAQALTHLGQAAAFRGDARMAAQQFSRASAVAAQAGEVFWEATSLAELGRLTGAGGRLNEAAALLEASRGRFLEIGHQWGLALALMSLGVVRCHQGQLDTANQHVRQSLGLFQGLGERGGMLGCLEALAVIQVRRGQMQSAAGLLGALGRLRDLTGFEPWSATSDELATAGRTAALALGDAAYQQAWTQGYTAPLEELLAETTHADAELMVSHLHGGAARLTAREREIAELIGQGLTSREMAQRLAISMKTADVHADRIRTKLGLRSRAEIAAWAVVQTLQPSE